MSYYLQLDGIDGDSVDRAHPRWHEVSGFSWGVAQSATPTGGGGGAGRPTLQPLVFTTSLTPAMPQLFEACVTGRMISKAVFEVTKDGRQPLVILKMEMDDVMLSTLSLAGADADPLPSESFSLTYRRIEITTWTVDARGRATLASSAAWDATGRP